LPGDSLPPTLAVVVLGLASSGIWGLSDFVAGVATKRAPLFGVMAVSQLIGVLIALPLITIHGEPLMPTSDVTWSIVSGVLGVTGLGFLYHGLSSGRMGVVAPVAGILVAGIPVAFGFAIQGAPPPIVMAGIGIAIASVATIARAPAGEGAPSSGLGWGLAAGITLGLLAVAISRLDPGFVFTPLAVLRTTETIICLVVIVATRRAWRIPRELWPATLAVGVLDMSGTATYLVAIQTGPLAIAAVLSALYPATTVLLAAGVLRERLSPSHVLGLLAAGVGVVLIAGGQAFAG